MSVYAKLNLAREKFHSLKLEKTGHNNFAGYNYFELGDFLIPALRVFNEVGLCAVLSFDKDMARMSIIDIAEPTSSLMLTSPMGSAALKGCHEVQNIGAVETYQRRYLWVAALEIVEHDVLDSTTGKAEKEKTGATSNHKVSATEEAFKMLDDETQTYLRKLAQRISAAESASQMIDVIDNEGLHNDHKAGLWHLLDSRTRSAIKKAQESQRAPA